eukprot:1302196-Pleurochrysis_carterae.AAC.2
MPRCNAPIRASSGAIPARAMLMMISLRAPAGVSLGSLAMASTTAISRTAAAASPWHDAHRRFKETSWPQRRPSLHLSTLKDESQCDGAIPFDDHKRTNTAWTEGRIAGANSPQPRKQSHASPNTPRGEASLAPVPGFASQLVP